MSTQISNQIELATRPSGLPSPENFRTVQVELPELGLGEVRVLNEFITVDPYMRGRMSGAKSYVAPFELGETMSGGAVGTVIESRAEELPVGTLVISAQGWRDIAQGPAADFQVREDNANIPHSLYLGLLGMPGMTAYVGLTEIGGIKAGDTVFVSGAAGAVGSAVGQIARMLGATRVIGSVGSDEKAALLKEKYGFDAVVNYKKGPIRQQLSHVASEGVDLYFDNVGGDHLEAALDVMKPHGRVAVCGAISGYNDESPQPGPDNLGQIVKKKLKLQGFIVGDHPAVAATGQEALKAWFTAAELVYDETVVEGLEHAPQAFIDMLQGGNIGKMVVKV
ncbi:NADP-dependent oxidoreductase [Corynebacterium sp. A21]|uniref:NADP-dependent oxidoreductase n=1 Tax=Corynebacterium sp. A21 TaxID=3457318 RepID=UPI003FD0BEF7